MKSKRQSRYSDGFLKSLTEWVTAHPFVRVSPITNGTLLLNGTRYPKLLCEVPIRELHNDMIKDTTDGGLHGAIVDGKAIMSGTELRRQLKRLLPDFIPFLQNEILPKRFKPPYTMRCKTITSVK